MEAPLSSPSHSQPSQYFQGAQSSVSSSSTSQTSSYTSQPAASTGQAQASSQQQQQQQAQTQRGGVSDANNATPFLRDFNLVAEAAKRAQMAVLMRDMEAVGL